MDKVRDRFRTREEWTLETKPCALCSGLLYVVPEGMWLHWSTLGEGCPRSASETAVERPYGPTLAERCPYPGDTAERGLALARCDGQYRRPSWEWMACR